MYRKKRLWEAGEDPHEKKRRIQEEQRAQEEKRKAEEQQETMSKRTKKEEDAMIMAVEELKTGKESKVTRKTGETRGGVEITIDVDKM